MDKQEPPKKQPHFAKYLLEFNVDALREKLGRVADAIMEKRLRHTEEHIQQIRRYGAMLDTIESQIS